jgi:hypothetical protein
LVSGDGQVFDAGEIVEAEPPRTRCRQRKTNDDPEAPE